MDDYSYLLWETKLAVLRTALVIFLLFLTISPNSRRASVLEFSIQIIS